MKDKLKDKKVKCRICNGEHFTARCPFKDTMAPVGEEGATNADVAAGPGDGPPGPGGLGAGKSSYVPPHMRGGASGASAAGDRMGGGKYERDDLATLRVTNVRISLCLLCIHTNESRSPKWLKNKNSGICLSATEESLGSSWPRTERLVWQRALRLSVSRSGPMQPRRARRWTAMDSSISSCASNLPKRRLKRQLREKGCLSNTANVSGREVGTLFTGDESVAFSRVMGRRATHPQVLHLAKFIRVNHTRVLTRGHLVRFFMAMLHFWTSALGS